jgi:Leucine-rich repeat (LRR) protein
MFLKFHQSADNELAALPESIADPTNLKKSSLSENKLTELPGSMGNLKSLRTLELNDNMYHEKEFLIQGS